MPSPGKMSLADLCSELAEKHRLSREETVSIVAAALSGSLTRALGRRVIICLDGDVLLIYKEEGDREGLKEIDYRSVRRDVVRLFRIRFGRELMKRKAVDDHAYLSTLQGTVMRGVVERVLDDGSLLVVIYIEEILTCRELYATCPLYAQSPHERGALGKGEARFFFVSSVTLVRRYEVLRNEVRLSRTTPKLTEALLARESGQVGIRCVRRIAWKISIAVSSTRLPREAVRAVSRELGERIVVRWRSAKNPSSRKKKTRKPTWE